MKDLLKNVDAKTITAAGGILVSFWLGYIILQITGERFTAVAKALGDLQLQYVNTNQTLANVLLENAKAIEGNTKVMEQLLRQK